MRIKFVHGCSTELGPFAAGDLMDMDAGLAAGFIAACLAVPDMTDEVEEAIAPEAVERAVSPKRRK